jgi:hypothetical protein
MLASLLLLCSAAVADNDKPKADPEGTPLEITITGKAVKFELDLGGLTSEEYKTKLEGLGKNSGRPPATPKVDLAIEIKNTSDKAVTVWSAGDSVIVELELKGKGAVSLAPNLAFTREFRLPTAKEIAPGKTLSIPVKSLTAGFRGSSTFSYWTAPGDYELIAKFKTGMNPPPKGAKDAGEGFGTVTLTSAALKVTVEEKK